MGRTGPHRRNPRSRCSRTRSLALTTGQARPYPPAEGCVGQRTDLARHLLPSRMSRSVGILCTEKRRAIPVASSTFTFTSFNCPARSSASFSRAGLMTRHGPHHGAHRSTRTRTLELSTTWANRPSSASVSHGSGALHWPQRGTPLAMSGTRFFRPQSRHRTMRSLMLPARSKSPSPWRPAAPAGGSS